MRWKNNRNFEKETKSGDETKFEGEIFSIITQYLIDLNFEKDAVHLSGNGLTD